MRYLVVLLLTGCASSTGVVPTGKDTFMVGGKAMALGASRHDATADAYREANAFCASHGKIVEVVKVDSLERSFARFPNANLEFRCVAK